MIMIGSPGEAQTRLSRSSRRGRGGWQVLRVVSRPPASLSAASPLSPGLVTWPRLRLGFTARPRKYCDAGLSLRRPPAAWPWPRLSLADLLMLP